MSKTYLCPPCQLVCLVCLSACLPLKGRARLGRKGSDERVNPNLVYAVQAIVSSVISISSRDMPNPSQ